MGIHALGTAWRRAAQLALGSHHLDASSPRAPAAALTEANAAFMAKDFQKALDLWTTALDAGACRRALSFVAQRGGRVGWPPLARPPSPLARCCS